MKKMFLISTVVASLLLMNSCKKTNPVADLTQTIVLPASGPSVVEANNRMAFKFLQATLQRDTDNNNKLVSPLSIYLALSMLYNGAAHATADSIAVALQLPGLDAASLNAVCQALMNQLPKEDNKVQFSIANSIWYAQNMPQPLPAFLGVTQNYYDAKVESLNFSDPHAVSIINNWVAQHTNNKITKITDELSPGDLMYLIDAIYFNGAWKTAFKTSDTYNGIFHLPDGSPETTPFMEQQVTVRMRVDSSFTLAELPYGGGNSYSLYIALPNNPEQPIGAFASSMNEKMLSDAIAKMDSANVQLNIPKWEYAYSIDDMRPELAALGMGIVFGAGADLSKLYDATQVQPYVSKAIHKTYIKVNEEGTEAAAVTAFGISSTAVLAPPVFRADRPFLYSIIEKQTGAVIFVGILSDPGLH